MAIRSFHTAEITANVPLLAYSFPPRPVDTGEPVRQEFAELRRSGGAPAWVESWASRADIHHGYCDILSWVHTGAPAEARDHAALAAWVQPSGARAFQVRVGRDTWYGFAKRPVITWAYADTTTYTAGNV